MQAVNEFTYDDVEARVALALASQPGDPVTSHMVAEHGPRGALRVMADLADGTMAGSRQLETWGQNMMRMFDPELTRDTLADAEHEDARLLTPDDPEWPARLDGQVEVAPLALWAVGDLSRLQEASRGPEVALVGTTNPSLSGSMTTAQLAADLTTAGYGVASPGGFGIGGAAVDGTVAADGHPLLVMPGRCKRLRAFRHDEVFEEAAESGLILAELAITDGDAATQIESRNRVLVPLADTIVLIEADADDLEMQTVRGAITHGIGTGVVLGPHRGGGCERLLQEGLAVQVHGAEDVSQMLDHINEHAWITQHHLNRDASPQPPVR